MYKVAILIPTTSNKRDEWKTIKDTYLFHSIKSFILSREYQDENTYTFYIGVDENDRIFDNKDQQNELKRFELVFQNVTFHLTEISKNSLAAWAETSLGA